jgi:hypothetical protein
MCKWILISYIILMRMNIRSWKLVATLKRKSTKAHTKLTVMVSLLHKIMWLRFYIDTVLLIWRDTHEDSLEINLTLGA